MAAEPSSNTDPILIVEQRSSVRILTLNRPKSRNALSAALLEMLRSELVEADKDDKTAVVVLTGTDPAFCAGLDLRELGESGASASRVPDSDIPIGQPWRPLSKPIIGAINGAAITGGLELALGCDFLIASERARFADTHARVGVMPNGGLTARLPEVVGRGYARRMSFSGDFVSAWEALRVGLVTQVVVHEELMPTVLALAVTLIGNDQSAVRSLLGSYRRAEAHLVEPALAVEDETSKAWMKSFDPSRVADRRADVISRGRGQSAAIPSLVPDE